DPVVGRHGTVPFMGSSAFGAGPASPVRIFGSSELSVIATARDRTMFPLARILCRLAYACGPFPIGQGCIGQSWIGQRLVGQVTGRGLPRGVGRPAVVVQVLEQMGAVGSDGLRPFGRPGPEVRGRGEFVDILEHCTAGIEPTVPG